MLSSANHIIFLDPFPKPLNFATTYKSGWTFSQGNSLMKPCNSYSLYELKIYNFTLSFHCQSQVLMKEVVLGWQPLVKIQYHEMDLTDIIPKVSCLFAKHCTATIPMWWETKGGLGRCPEATRYIQPRDAM